MLTSESDHQVVHSLPDPLPDAPMALFGEWYELAQRKRLQPNTNVMYLATAGADGAPDVRAVLCKGMDLEKGHIVFYTNYRSLKGRQLAANPNAGVVFHWDHLGLQVRMRGPVTKSPEEESDAYYASRPLISQVGAWASDQSEPVDSRDTLLENVRKVLDEHGLTMDDLDADAGTGKSLPRPPHWGGFRVWASRVEMWVNGEGRLHDRAAWTRDVEVADGDVRTGAWAATRLFP